MTFMGYETPVELPSMGVYDTDLMKLYIAGAKDLYEKAREDMKDFMKTYGDFYSDIPGATELYNKLTIGGANELIGEMYARGIDPYKSPQARQLIGRYIASAPVGLLKQMEKSAENAKAYKAIEAKMKASGIWGSDDFQREMLGGKLLEEWDPRKPFTATSPYEYKDLDALTVQQFTPFKAQEYVGKSRPGYVLRGTPQERQELAIKAAIDDLPNSAQGRYQITLAKRLVEEAAAAQNRTLTPEELLAATQMLLYQNVKERAAKFFQPKEEADALQLGIILDNHRTANDLYLYKEKEKLAHERWAKEHPEYNPNSPLYKGRKDNKLTSTKTGKSYASWFEMMNDLLYVNMTNTQPTFIRGQVGKIGQAFKDKNGNTVINDSTINKALRVMSQTVPNYTASTIFSRTQNADGSINISASDLRRMYHKNHIASRMEGSPMTPSNYEGQTKELRNDLRKAFNVDRRSMSNSNNFKNITASVANEFVYYINKNGKVKIFMPARINYGLSENDHNDDVMIDTGITGRITKDGSFVADNEQYLNTIDKDMTHKFANKSDYSEPINPSDDQSTTDALYDYFTQQPGFVWQP